MRSNRLCIALLLLFICLFFSVAGCGDVEVNSPQAVLEKAFAAMARGDSDALEGMLTLGAKAAMPDQGSREAHLFKSLGAAFEGVAAVNLKQSEAHALVKVSRKKLIARMLLLDQARLATIKDPRLKERMKSVLEAGAEAVARKYTPSYTMVLVRPGDEWLIDKLW